MRVMVVSPVRLFRDCLAAALGSMQPVPEVVAEVSITVLHHRSVGELPDVVLVDVTQDIGIEEVARVAAKWPNLRLLALGLLEHREEVVSHGRAGFVSYLARDAAIEDLQSAISGAVADRMRPPAAIGGGPIRALFDKQHPSKPSHVAPMLTKQETEVLQIIPLFPLGGNLRTRSPPDNRIADPPRATNSRPVGSTPQPSTIDEGKSRVPPANGVKRKDSSHVATGTITALLATALVYLSKWPLQALDPPTASAFAGLLVAFAGALVKYYKSRSAVPAPPVASVVPLAPPSLVQEPPAAA
jgi:two-component system nitrate/nitrite response regulator NarL